MFYVTSEIYLNNDLGSLAVSVDNYPQKRKNHLTITYYIHLIINLNYILIELILQGRSYLSKNNLRFYIL